MWLGAHVGVSGGLAEASHDGRRIGCECIQIFSKSPHMWKGPAIAPAAAEAFRAAVVEDGLHFTAVHHGYLANLASPKPFVLRNSRAAFRDELDRADLLGVNALIFHPGAHMKSGVEAGLTSIATSLNLALEARPESKVRVLLENAAGQGTALCSRLEELATVLAQVNYPGRVGVTLDTCHLFAAGYDFRSDEAYGALMDQVEKVLGRTTVRAFHLNDAKSPLGSHRDRHENIGKGEIGTEGFRHLVNDPRWAETPGFLETPLDEHDYAKYVADLRTLRSLIAPAAGAAPAAPAARRSTARRSTVK